MKRTVHITIVPDGDGFVAECAELHAVTQGNTLEATIANAREVVALAFDGESPTDLGFVADPSLTFTIELGPLSHAG